MDLTMYSGIKLISFGGVYPQIQDATFCDAANLELVNFKFVASRQESLVITVS